MFGVLFGGRALPLFHFAAYYANLSEYSVTPRDTNAEEFYTYADGKELAACTVKEGTLQCSET